MEEQERLTCEIMLKASGELKALLELSKFTDTIFLSLHIILSAGHSKLELVNILIQSTP